MIQSSNDDFRYNSNKLGDDERVYSCVQSCCLQVINPEAVISLALIASDLAAG